MLCNTSLIPLHKWLKLVSVVMGLNVSLPSEGSSFTRSDLPVTARSSPNFSVKKTSLRVLPPWSPSC